MKSGDRHWLFGCFCGALIGAASFALGELLARSGIDWSTAEPIGVLAGGGVVLLVGFYVRR